MIFTGCASHKPATLSGTTHLAPGFQAPVQHREAVASAPRVEPPVGQEKTTAHKIIWYVPNRLLDLVDIFRIRLRVGPGLSLNVRVTDYADIFAGTYYTAFIGLPGPRLQPDVRWPWGLEYEKGLKLMGVDATDDLDHEPDYTPTEFNAGIQLFILGLELGFDPVEFGDFFAGLFLIDLRGDDR